MVRLGRLERPTSCFGGTRSIQLSYSRALPLYHALRVARMVVLNFRSPPALQNFPIGFPHRLCESAVVVLESARYIFALQHDKKGNCRPWHMMSSSVMPLETSRWRMRFAPRLNLTASVAG